MSHTGTVTRPNLSPGIIRVITTGYVVSEDSKIVFRKPADGDMLNKSAEERFILFMEQNEDGSPKKVERGTPVRFNLELLNDWLEEKEKGDSSEYQKFIEDKEKKEIVVKDILKRKIIDYKFPFVVDAEVGRYYQNILKNQLLSQVEKFEFKYIATEVAPMTDKFILTDFLNIIGLLDDQSMENFIDGIKGINYYRFWRQQPIYCAKGAEAESQFRVRNLEVLDALEFDSKYGKPDSIEEPYEGSENVKHKVSTDVDDEIEFNKGRDLKPEHKMSPLNELPTYIRMNSKI